MLNKSFPNSLSLFPVTPKIVFISVRDLSTSIADETIPLRAAETAPIAATDAPKAITRAFEASKDFSNSPSCPLILPKG